MKEFKNNMVNDLNGHFKSGANRKKEARLHLQHNISGTLNFIGGFYTAYTSFHYRDYYPCPPFSLQVGIRVSISYRQ